MAKILGLDLGTNSIGWALIDDVQNKILGIGSRIFPMGVENLGEGEEEKCLKMLDEQEQEVFVVNF
jgi:CRISPR-associated endonuclease Csn1